MQLDRNKLVKRYGKKWADTIMLFALLGKDLSITLNSIEERIDLLENPPIPD